MAWAFEAYASGRWTLITLREALLCRGLTTVPGPKRPAKPISVSQLHRFLRSSYYIGKVTWGGVEYDGEHPPLVSVETWERVQDLLTSRNTKGEKHRAHPHYLKSSLYCGRCGSRLIVSHNTNRHGTTYPYFVCLGRHQKRTDCRQRAIRIETIEELVADHYVEHSLTADEAADLRTYLTAEFARMREERQDETARLRREQARLEDEQLKLLQAHYADAVPIPLMKREQQRLGAQIDAVERKVCQLDTQFAEVEANLDRVLSYLTDLADTYGRSGPMLRRQINQAVFSRIEVTDDGTVTAVLNEPYAAITDPQLRHASIIYRQGITEAVQAVQNERRRRSGDTTASVAHVRSFLTVARRAAGVKQTHLAVAVVSEFRT